MSDFVLEEEINRGGCGNNNWIRKNKEVELVQEFDDP